MKAIYQSIEVYKLKNAYFSIEKALSKNAKEIIKKSITTIKNNNKGYYKD